MQRAVGCARAAGDPIPLSRLGVDRFSSRDQWSTLRQAFATAAADGLSLIADPDGIYRHDGPLTLDGVSFDGQGCTLRSLSDGPQVLRCLGSNWRLANLRILGTATQRSSENNRNGLWIGDEGAHTASNFVLENVTVDAVEPGRGVATAGIMFSNAHHGRIVAPTVRHSLADGIHITAGSSELLIERPLVEDSGDDAVAIVSYRQQQRICRTIRVTDAVSRRSAARGISVVGGLDVQLDRVRVEKSSAAGVYLYGEQGFDTYGVARCRVTDPVLVDCVTGRHLPPGYSNAAIVIGGRDGADVVDGMTVGRGAADCVVHNPVVTGAGSACTAAISTHQFALRPHVIGGRIRGPAPGRAGAATGGIEIGGQDVTVEGLRMTDIVGLAIVVLPTASGTCQVLRPQVDGSLLRSGPISSYLYAEAAPALRRLVVRDGRFTRGPKQLSTSLLPTGRLLLERNRLD